jgi:hypothetical protein
VVEGSDEVKKRIRNSTTGDFVDLEGKTITWTNWQNERLRRNEYPLETTTMELVRTGIWQTDSGIMGTSHLLSANESDLPGIPEEDLGTMEQRVTGLGSLGSVIRFFLVLIVAILLVESWLFHRYAVY